MKNEIKIWEGNDQVPGNACRFALEDAVSFAENSGDKKMVKLVGYRGDIIKHWYWGNLAFDMDGLHFDKNRTPGLIDHNSSMRLTYSKDRAVKPETFIAGPFLGNDKAMEVKKDMENDFPFQASLSLKPELVEQVADGQSVEVNGIKLKGPGAVFRRAAIMEISAVVFGAFSNTESALYSDNSESKYQFELVNKEHIMPKEKENQMTLEQFSADYPDLHKLVFEQGKAEGIKAQTERFARLQKACGDDSELLVKCFAEGLDTGDAMSKRIEKLSARNKDLTEQLSVRQTTSDQSRGTKADPAVSEFNNQPKPQNQQAEKFDESQATDEQLKEHFAKTKDLQDEYTCAEAYVEAVHHPAK